MGTALSASRLEIISAVRRWRTGGVESGQRSQEQGGEERE
jgi:hypothetical protein